MYKKWVHNPLYGQIHPEFMADLIAHHNMFPNYESESHHTKLCVRTVGLVKHCLDCNRYANSNVLSV